MKFKMTVWEGVFLGLIIVLTIGFIIAQSPKDARYDSCVKDFNKLANFTNTKCFCEGQTIPMFPDYSQLGGENEINKKN